MPPQCRLGDMADGHPTYPPTNAIKGSPNVMVNGKPAVRLGDDFAPHCPVPKLILAKGSSKVMINGKPAGRVGDNLNCPAKVVKGSSNVITG